MEEPDGADETPIYPETAEAAWEAAGLGAARRPPIAGPLAEQIPRSGNGAAVAPLLKLAAPITDERPRLELSTDRERVTDIAMGAIGADKMIFQRARRLIRVSRDRYPKDGVSRPTGTPVIEELPEPILLERLSSALKIEKWDDRKRDWKAAHPPTWLSQALLARGDWPEVRVLVGTSEIPIIRPNGTIFDNPGYDAETGIGYDPGGCRVKVPIPTQDQAGELADQLCRSVADHPFEDEGHMAAWVAGLLSIVGRPAFSGPCPMFLVDANVRGAGKGLLVQVAANIAFGRDCAVGSYTHDGPEFEKLITSIAIAGDSMILLDNVEGRLGNAAMDRLLTGTIWQGRILGKNAKVEMPMRTVWWATANNAQVGADTARRCLHVRLDCLQEAPEDRSGFAHPDLLGWVRNERQRLLAASMGILAGFFRAGCPQPPINPLGSFEAWSKIIRSAVIWAGLHDPCETRAKLAAFADSHAADAARLIDALKSYLLPTAAGITTVELAAELWGTGEILFRDEDARKNLRNAVEAAIPNKGRPPNSNQIAYKFRSLRRTVFGKLLLDSDGESHDHQLKWVIREL